MCADWYNWDHLMTSFFSGNATKAVCSSEEEAYKTALKALRSTNAYINSGVESYASGMLRRPLMKFVKEVERLHRNHRVTINQLIEAIENTRLLVTGEQTESQHQKNTAYLEKAQAIQGKAPKLAKCMMTISAVFVAAAVYLLSTGIGAQAGAFLGATGICMGIVGSISACKDTSKPLKDRMLTVATQHEHSLRYVH